ncbi:MAG: hypothetical protein MNPFHGCM_02001 [Gemmatimonadaceae bacterium]|nr:hypothetical protein [Gemmatimonadaceae bacterium]
MRLIRGDGRDFSDDEVRATLQAHYAPPTDEGYWAALERRVMARVLSEGATTREWWSYFRGWVRIGIAAGIAAATIAGVAAWRTREARDRVAYEELLGSPSTLPILTETMGNDTTGAKREATLRYLLSQ